MARTARAFPLAVALGAALVAPSSAIAINGGAAPIASVAASGGAAPGQQPAAMPRRGASSARTGGAVPGRTPVRRGTRTRAPSRRRATAPRRVAPVGPAPAPAPDAPPVGGLFPVQGSYTFGGEDARFGAGRPGHVHQGQDVVAASGTPLVSPVTGTVTWKSNQPGGAGIYLVIRGTADGRDYVFMHLLRGSVQVAQGDAVAAGQAIAQVGATGVASGPHLHFEIWVGGWQERGGAPIDPLPQLEAWAAGGS